MPRFRPSTRSRRTSRSLPSSRRPRASSGGSWALTRTVATGVRVAPLYTGEDAGDLPTSVGVPGVAPFVRGARAGADPQTGVPGGWDVRQRHAHPDVAVTKEAIAADLQNGATSLWLVLGEGAIPVDR